GFRFRRAPSELSAVPRGPRSDAVFARSWRKLHTMSHAGRRMEFRHHFPRSLDPHSWRAEHRRTGRPRRLPGDAMKSHLLISAILVGLLVGSAKIAPLLIEAPLEVSNAITQPTPVDKPGFV